MELSNPSGVGPTADPIQVQVVLEVQQLIQATSYQQQLVVRWSKILMAGEESGNGPGRSLLEQVEQVEEVQWWNQHSDSGGAPYGTVNTGGGGGGGARPSFSNKNWWSWWIRHSNYKVQISIMSEVKVNKISPRTACGTTTLGDSGDTLSAGVPVTVQGDLKSPALKATDGTFCQSGNYDSCVRRNNYHSSGTASGFGATGESVNWDTTSS